MAPPAQIAAAVAVVAVALGAISAESLGIKNPAPQMPGGMYGMYGSYGMYGQPTPYDLLDPTATHLCQTPCSQYSGGAGPSTPVVCQYRRSGVGTLGQAMSGGSTCMPSYGCSGDWVVCYQDPLVPLAAVNAAAFCPEITGLASGGYGGKYPPAGGWQPTTMGWLKAEGTCSCGWGSTYSNVAPDSSGDLALFGRVVCVGGGSLAPGFAERLSDELRAILGRASCPWDVRVFASNERRCARRRAADP